tara:strand:- start:2582 stop:3235 length:654 start_codon:yes stop_codon:yes gene_type:complete
LASNIKWEGIERYERKLISLANARTAFHKEYLDVIGDLTLKMIRQAAPKKTGNYANSWSIVKRAEKFIVIDTSMPDLFNWLENGTGEYRLGGGSEIRAEDAGIQAFPTDFGFIPGTKGMRPQRHIIHVQDKLDQVMRDVMRAQMKKHNKLFNHMRANGMPSNSNLTKTVGLTGTNVSSLRGRGKISMVRARTGRKQFKRRLGRRRRTGQWIKRATAD